VSATPRATAPRGAAPLHDALGGTPGRYSYDPRDYVVMEGHRDHTEMTRRRGDGDESPLAGAMLPMMIEGGYGVSIFVVGGDGDHHRDGDTRPLVGSLDVMDLFYEEVRKVPGASVVYDKGDLPAGPEPGRLRFILEIEGGRPFQEDYSSGRSLARRLHLFRTFYRLGMRHLHLAHNGRNELADGHDADLTGGRLSPFGVAVVKEANRLGVTITLGHLSEPCWFHALEVSEQPVLCTHSNATALVSHRRNVTDEQIRAVARQGGVVGVHLWSPIQDPELPPLDELVGHVRYMADLVGPQYVGFGILNRDRSYLKWSASAGKDLVRTAEEPEGVSYRRGLAMFIERLDRAGFSQEEVRGILGENYLRVFRHNLPTHSPRYWDYQEQGRGGSA
jgi:membrane dipeptidase